MLVFNTGVGILTGEYGLGLIADKFGRRLVAGPLFTATAASMNYGWFIWILLPGTFIPGLLIAIFGNRQSGRALELLAE
jgi:hypothetical protein